MQHSINLSVLWAEIANLSAATEEFDAAIDNVRATNGDSKDTKREKFKAALGKLKNVIEHMGLRLEMQADDIHTWSIKK